MKLCIVAVFDVKAEAFTIPQFVGARGVALRSFTDACRNKETPFGQHPEDYALYMLGEFEDGEGSIMTNPPELIAKGSDCTGE